jgi:hypothetical protein
VCDFQIRHRVQTGLVRRISVGVTREEEKREKVKYREELAKTLYQKKLVVARNKC